jgi:triacylglycerol lipase
LERGTTDRVRPSLRVRVVVALLGLVTGGFLAVPPSARAGTAYDYPTMGVAPVGANDWTCPPTAERPDPAVIVHGMFGDQKSLLGNLSLALVQQGYCVYSLDYGNRATGPIETSAQQLKDFVDRVLGATGAAKVEMVGHSQGGMMPRYYIKNLGGSPDETPGAVDYTQVTTRNDEVVVPYSSAFLTADAQSTNILLQDRCPVDAADHLTIPMDQQAIAWVLDAFGRVGPADASAPIGCTG